MPSRSWFSGVPEPAAHGIWEWWESLLRSQTRIKALRLIIPFFQPFIAAFSLKAVKAQISSM
jgi:hypothetical protein